MALDFPGIGNIGVGGPSSGAPAKKVVPELTEIEKLNKQVEALDRELTDANTALRTSVAQPAMPTPQRVAPPGVPPEPGPMPDPATKPDEFAEWLNKRDAYTLHSATTHSDRRADATDATSRSTTVIDAFLAANPKYAKLRDQVFQSYTVAARELGIEVIPADTTQLDTLVGDKMKTLFDAVAGDRKADGENTDTDEPATRTAGLSGGSTEALAGGAIPTEEDGIKIRPFTEQLRARQDKSDLF